MTILRDALQRPAAMASGATVAFLAIILIQVFFLDGIVMVMQMRMMSMVLQILQRPYAMAMGATVVFVLLSFSCRFCFWLIAIV